MSISKKVLTGLVFSTVAVSLVGGAFVANAQTSSTSNSQNNSSLGLKKQGKGGDFREKMMNDGEFKDGLMSEMMDGRQFGGKSGKARGGQMMDRLESKYQIDTSLTDALKAAQTNAQTAKKAYKEARKSNASNVNDLKTKTEEARKAVQVAREKVQNTIFEARVAEAKTLGVDQTVIDNFVKAEKAQEEMRTEMETLRASDATTLGQIKELRAKHETTRDASQTARQAFQDAFKAKSTK